MKRFVTSGVLLANALLGTAGWGQEVEAERVPSQVVQPSATVLKELPREIKHENTRLYDFEFEPPLGAVVPNGSRLRLRFKYETDSPKNLFLGALPFVNDQAAGGYEPAALNAGKGTADVWLILMVPHSPLTEFKTLEELRASYVPLEWIELSLYGRQQTHRTVRVPVKFSVIPGASFTVQEKFYIERLLQEVISLRKRVQELESKLNAN